LSGSIEYRSGAADSRSSTDICNSRLGAVPSYLPMRGICALLGKSSVLPPGPWRWLLRLQFPFKLVKKPPIGSLGDECRGAHLDHPHLVEAQGMETQCVLGTRGAPVSLGNETCGQWRFRRPHKKSSSISVAFSRRSRKGIELPQRVSEKPACSKPEARSEGGLLDRDACLYGRIREALLSAETRFRWKLSRCTPVTFR